MWPAVLPAQGCRRWGPDSGAGVGGQGRESQCSGDMEEEAVCFHPLITSSWPSAAGGTAGRNRSFCPQLPASHVPQGTLHEVTCAQASKSHLPGSGPRPGPPTRGCVSTKVPGCFSNPTKKNIPNDPDVRWQNTLASLLSLALKHTWTHGGRLSVPCSTVHPVPARERTIGTHTF